MSQFPAKMSNMLYPNFLIILILIFKQNSFLNICENSSWLYYSECLILKILNNKFVLWFLMCYAGVDYLEKLYRLLGGSN